MGIKGDKHTNAAAELADLVAGKLEPIGGITTKKMFGGYGIFHDGKMFGMISAKGQAFIKYDDDVKQTLEGMGGEKHSKMPYFSVPETHINSPGFVDLAQKAIQLSKS